MPKRKRENSEYDDNVTVSLHNKRKKFNDVFTFFLPIIAEAVISGYGVNKKQKDYLPLSTSQYRTVKRSKKKILILGIQNILKYYQILIINSRHISRCKKNDGETNQM